MVEHDIFQDSGELTWRLRLAQAEAQRAVAVLHGDEGWSDDDLMRSRSSDEVAGGSRSTGRGVR